MLLVRKHLVLQWQEGAARIDEVHARETILQSDLLGPQMLLDGHRVVRAALHRGIVGDDDDFLALDAPDAGDEARGGRISVVHAEGGELRELEEGRARIQQGAHALARQELAAVRVLLLRIRPAALGRLRDLRAQVFHERAVVRDVGLEGFASGVEARLDLRHGQAAFPSRSARASFTHSCSLSSAVRLALCAMKAKSSSASRSRPMRLSSTASRYFASNPT